MHVQNFSSALRGRKAIAYGLMFSLSPLFLAACGGGDTSGEESGKVDTWSITMSDYLPPTTPFVPGGVTPFQEAVVELAAEQDIDAEVEYFGNSELHAADETLDAVSDGVTDITFIPAAYFAERIPEAGVVELPGMFDSATEGTEKYHRFSKEVLGETLNELGLQAVFAVAQPPYQLGMGTEKVEDPSQARGKLLRTPGGPIGLSIEALGATAVELASTDQYVGLERGTVDGVISPATTTTGNKLEEVLGYHTNNLSLGSVGAIFVANLDWWQSLTAEQQQILESAGDRAAEHFGPYVDDAVETSYETMEEAGVEIYAVPDPAAWEDVLYDVHEVWAGQIDEQGGRGSEILAEWNDFE